MNEDRLTARTGAPIIGEAAIPGDKSCSHRALILGAMAEGTTSIRRLSDCADVQATIAALRAFGRKVEPVGNSEWRVEGGPWSSPDAPIDCGNSGTTARLLIGAAAGMAGVSATFTGDSSLSARPMRRLVEPLRRMGAVIGGGDSLPLTVTGGTLGGMEHRNLPASAQVKSALLLAGLSATAPVRIVEPMPSRDHLETMLREFGVELETFDGRERGVVVLGDRRRLEPATIAIAGDPSAAAFPLLAAAIVPGSEARVGGLNVNPLRTGLFEVLERMGADINLDGERVESGEIVADIRLRHAALGPCQVAADEIPAMIDEVPALAVACAFADGESVIDGLGELRFKESDRLGAIVAGLTACGVTALARGDRLHIFGRGSVRGGASVATHGDHRIAMAFLVLGLASDRPVTVDRPEMIATSFPGFIDTMRALGADIA